MLIKENEQRLIELRQQLESQNSSELSNRDQKYSNRIAELTETLSGKIAEIRNLRSSQQSFLESVTEKEKLLESSKSRVDQLTRDLSFCGDSLCSVRGERDAFKEKIIQLEVRNCNMYMCMHEQCIGNFDLVVNGVLLLL